MQKRLKNDTKISIFLKFSNGLKNVSRHCHYNIKIKHFEHFSGGGLFQPPPCQVGLRTSIKTLIAGRPVTTVDTLGEVAPVVIDVVHFTFWTDVVITFTSQTVPVLGTTVGVGIPPIRLAAAV